MRKRKAKTIRKRKALPSTPERREKARARHWRRTGVSESTIRWMRDTGQL